MGARAFDKMGVCSSTEDESRIKKLEEENAALEARLKAKGAEAEGIKSRSVREAKGARTGEVATLPEEAKEKIYKDYVPTAEDKRDDSWKALKKLKRKVLIEMAFGALDSAGNGHVSMKEVEMSCLNIEKDSSLTVNKEEWAAWFESIEKGLGKKKSKEFIVDLLWNADILTESAEEEKETAVDDSTKK